MNAFYRRTAVILKLLPETRVELLNKNLSPIWFTQDQILQLLNLKKKNSFNEHKRATLKGDIKKRTVENHNNNKIY